MKRAELEKLPDVKLLEMHDNIHRIMDARALDMKKRHREKSNADSLTTRGKTSA